MASISDGQSNSNKFLLVSKIPIRIKGKFFVQLLLANSNRSQPKVVKNLNENVIKLKKKINQRLSQLAVIWCVAPDLFVYAGNNYK